jgi:hypothetical protein
VRGEGEERGLARLDLMLVRARKREGGEKKRKKGFYFLKGIFEKDFHKLDLKTKHTCGQTMKPCSSMNAIKHCLYIIFLFSLFL